MDKGVFITGTDTGIGKTWFTVALMEALKKQGHLVSGMKPIASGASLNDGSLRNEDANMIMRHSSQDLDYDLINPVVFELPVAPHIAAGLNKKTIDVDKIVECYKQITMDCERIVVEGVGGWRVPVSPEVSTVDLVRRLNLPVIIVVGIKLGCINHALLSAEAIMADGMRLCGWVSNRLDKTCLKSEEVIETLKNTMNCPHIADLPYMDIIEPSKMSDKIDQSFLMSI
jgi:dethiobiotin synthetase